MKIVLIGMAGVGKSYIGKKLAERLAFKCIDVDHTLKEKTGLGTTELLEKLGDEKYIELESETFSEALSKYEDAILAPGGSIIYCQSFMDNLDKMKVFYLKSENLDRILERVKKEPRGIVYSSKYSFEELFMQRAKLYEKHANYIIDMTHSEEQILQEMCDTILTDKKNLC